MGRRPIHQQIAVLHRYQAKTQALQTRRLVDLLDAIQRTTSASPWDPRRLVLLDSNLECWTVSTVVDLLELRGRNVAEGRVQPLVVPPCDP
jgi:hypothetical protein